MATEPQRPMPRAVRIARANGLGYVAFGILTLLSSLSSLPSSGLDALLGGWLTAAGLVERRAASALEQTGADAHTTLARNELALCAAIVGYAALRISVLPSPALSDPALLGDALGVGAAEIEEMARDLTRIAYGTVAVVSVLYQGGMALYFGRFGRSRVGV